ncbi:Glycerophosphoryl diester phosphodiesterase (EC [Olavius sp. associated proteobacterium Delta 1]|nr:Glycerophosphoryl diester phosphodiesterase (EC [Olavius sp. associated proteobacterium Delta 1]
MLIGERYLMNTHEGKIRRFSIYILIIIVALFFLVSCRTPENGTPGDGNKLPAKKLLIVGHRGAAGLAPENTLAAFGKACELGVDAVELDVLLTLDGKIAVHHDYTLKSEITRTPDGEWLNRPGSAIKDLTLAQLKTYDVGRLKPNTRYSRRYPEQQPADGERIPNLGEVISMIEAKCGPANQLWVEIKTNPEKPHLTPAPTSVADAVVKLLREQDFVGRVRILSFDWRGLIHIQKIAPEIPTVYLSLVGRGLNNIKPGQPGPSPWMAGYDIDDFQGSIPQAVKAAGGLYWAPYYKHTTDNLLKEAHELGLQVYVWTVDSSSEIVRMIEMGVDGIITNRPDILKAVVGLR